MMLRHADKFFPQSHFIASVGGEGLHSRHPETSSLLS